jgi:small subunit ribosomal protein S17
MKPETKNTGTKLTPPKQSCNDKKCPFHGNIKTRGRIFTGKVISKDLSNTATVVWTRKHFIPKYERSETRRTKIRVHNPPCINAKVNDMVKIIETRPLSKTKHFVIVECIKKKVLAKKKVAAK